MKLETVHENEKDATEKTWYWTLKNKKRELRNY
jgi:hypothetical protein